MTYIVYEVLPLFAWTHFTQVKGKEDIHVPSAVTSFKKRYHFTINFIVAVHSVKDCYESNIKS